VAEAGRVIAGSARGTRLVAPGEGTRPLSDRVKQTLFAILEPDLRGARVLDLFAGSGAAGIEALSRGAASADFVERDATAARVIAANLARTHVEDRGRIHRRDVAAFIRNAAAGLVPAMEPFDVVIVDPPYADTTAMTATLEALAAAAATLLTADCWVVAKHFWRTPPPAAIGLLASIRSRRFGETTLTFYRPAGREVE
jgi:16S rRNA (guanine966-N2)-methyltransferase